MVTDQLMTFHNKVHIHEDCSKNVKKNAAFRQVYIYKNVYVPYKETCSLNILAFSSQVINCLTTLGL